MTAVLTFIGGENMDIAKTTMGHPSTIELTFPLNQPVTIDPDTAKNAPERAMLEHIICKAKTNRFFKVDGIQNEGSLRSVPPPSREVGEIIPGVPENWRELHHKTKMKIARDLGHDVTTLEGAEMAIEAEVQKRAENAG